MHLADLVAALQPAAVTGALEGEVTRVVHDSRQAGPDAGPDVVFVAIRGAHSDGRRFVPGLRVAAVIADAPVQAEPGVPVIQVTNARRALAQAAALLAGQPSTRLPVIGITGTNGKTTVSFMLEAIAVAAGGTAGVIGTTGHRVAGVGVPTQHTTPEAPTIQALLARMADAGCALAAVEVSSIGLSMHRVDGTRFAAAVFTSFSQDHLDFHGSMEAYLQAKLRLFSELLAPEGTAVIWGPDPVADRVAAAAGARRVWRYGRAETAEEARGLDLVATDVRLGLDGAEAQVRTPMGEGELHLKLAGAHNVDNALGALGAALAVGIPLDRALAGLAGLRAVPGRLEPVPDPAGVRTVLVDYAHTPDALARTLATLRSLGPRRLLLVMGCGGDRDRGKRPAMGQVAVEGADHTWVTSDNPRSEDPAAIIAEILAGVPAALRTRLEGQAQLEVQLDRARAITAAVAAAGPGDTLLIAGKGHETTQTIGDQVLPFDDREVAAAALAAHPPAPGARP